jgi:hypothetical protein
MSGAIVQDIKSRQMYVINKKNRAVKEITIERLGQILHPKLDVSRRRYTCDFDYNPKTPVQLYKANDGIWVFNQYRPPEWKSDFFYDNKEIKKVNELPELYEKYFNHLVGRDSKSFNYILDWIAFGLQDRNFCILTTIGMSGAGKGKLSEILELVFGKSNFTRTGNNLLTKDFNAQVANKQLVYINEASVKDQSQEERVKALVDFSIEIEKKGQDAYNATNYANFYFSSNFLDSIRIPEKDRRFSIVNLTDKQLEDVMTGKEIDDLLLSENICELARYLYYRPVEKQNMIKPFKSERTEEVREAGLSAWQEWFLDDYCIEKAGQTIPMKDVTEAIFNEFGYKFRPSKAAFRILQNIYPKKFKVFKPISDSTGKQVTSIEFPLIEKIPSQTVISNVVSKQEH